MQENGLKEAVETLKRQIEILFAKMDHFDNSGCGFGKLKSQEIKNMKEDFVELKSYLKEIKKMIETLNQFKWYLIGAFAIVAFVLRMLPL